MQSTSSCITFCFEAIVEPVEVSADFDERYLMAQDTVWVFKEAHWVLDVVYRQVMLAGYSWPAAYCALSEDAIFSIVTCSEEKLWHGRGESLEAVLSWLGFIRS